MIDKIIKEFRTGYWSKEDFLYNLPAMILWVVGITVAVFITVKFVYPCINGLLI